MEIPTRARVFTSVSSRSPHLELRSSSRRRIESSTFVSCGQPASRPASQQTSRLARPSLLSRPPAPSTFAHCRRNKRASRDMASGVWLLRPPRAVVTHRTPQPVRYLPPSRKRVVCCYERTKCWACTRCAGPPRTPCTALLSAPMTCQEPLPPRPQRRTLHRGPGSETEPQGLRHRSRRAPVAGAAAQRSMGRDGIHAARQTYERGQGSRGGPIHPRLSPCPRPYISVLYCW